LGKRVFISKNASEVETLNDYLLSKGDCLIPHSFLLFSQLEFDLEEEYDVIFFGSPRAIFFFKSQTEIPDSAKIACVGSKTAEIIKVINREASFIGNGDINSIANDFKEWCGERKVLFPVSSISLKTVSSKFHEDQKIEVEAYSTEIIGSPIEECDVYVFTSPSNVKGFLESNTIPKESQVIAWGLSSEKELKNNGINVDSVLADSTIDELMTVL